MIFESFCKLLLRSFCPTRSIYHKCSLTATKIITEIKQRDMLVCFGSPLIDIIAFVDDQFLKKFQLAPDNAIHSPATQQQIFQEILSFNHKIVLGGSVTNTARVFQWMSKKPNSVFYVGTIGYDEFGQMIRKKLEEDQICHYLLENVDNETGKCAVLVSGNEKHRSLVTDLGASKIFDVQNLDCPRLQNILEISDYLYISAFFLGVSTAVVRNVISTFKKQGDHKKLVVNLGAPFLSEVYPEEIKFMFYNADIVIGNEKEFLSFANMCGIYLSEEKLENNIINLSNSINQKAKNNLLIITRGSDSIITFEIGKIQYHEVEPVKNIVDTNGAGDAFIGGFLAKFAEKSTLEECIKCGTWCARIILQYIGCDFDKKLLYK